MASVCNLGARDVTSDKFRTGCVSVFVFQTVPFGVLCFLPSYKSMDKLMNRWKASTLFVRYAGDIHRHIQGSLPGSSVCQWRKK